ncbi:N1R/p28-like protein [Adoxophyes honmai entomopoxvirus 'L']|uniref:N1R/p28-like protein n=1 Tax=Adoxophyes honmai entomopoxvirus 'L' TaxID=1293540 RepID=A0A916KPJ4_9POXV|nr:N1R/p28-like protein [Adoxophyes honmai entomopoxvirus 'L']CCU55450.1 N1R/p28-like protein [Adoxophyes honmai entomopoxvirus 'L']
MLQRSLLCCIWILFTSMTLKHCLKFYCYNIWIVVFKTITNMDIKTIENKYNMKDIFKILKYDNCEEQDLVENLESNKLMDIFTFIKDNNYDLELGVWFRDIWYPLFNKKDVLITNDILCFIYNFQGGKHFHPWNIDKNYQNKKDYKSFLIKNKIDFDIIKYHKNIINEYSILRNEISLYDNNNLVQKTWLLLSVDDFKESIMMMNNTNSKIIRKYYIKLERILFDYNNKLKDIKLKELEYKKNKEIEEHKMELIKANKKALMINKFMNNTVIKSDKLEWIYIASTDQYQQNKLYKIGSTERLHKRIKSYQTGRPDEYYYIWVKPCYNSKDLDYHIQNLLKDFKYKSNRELYHGISIDDLIEIIDFIMDNYDKALEYVYDFIKNKLQNSIIKDIIIKKPLDITSISYDIGGYTETINIDEENNNLIRRELFNFLETIEDKSIIKRIDLLGKLKINMNKLDIWKELKNTLKWKNSNKIVKYNDKEFYLQY